LFSCALIFAHRAFWAAAIFLRADADIVRFEGARMVVTSVADCDCFRTPSHLALCASTILRREAADMIRVGRLDSWTPVPSNLACPRELKLRYAI
jgi:hypothetical protein